MAVLRDITNEATRRLRQVSGTHVQVYTEQQLVDIANTIFVSLFDRYNLTQYDRFRAFTLAGDNGYLLEDMSSYIRMPVDIVRILDDMDNDIHKAKFVRNPLRLTGTRPLAYQHDTNPQRLLQFFPFAATGTVYIRYKARPTRAFELDDDIPLPKDIFVAGCCADYLKSDGANPDDANKFVALFDAHVKTLLASEAAPGVPNQRGTLLQGSSCFTIA